MFIASGGTPEALLQNVKTYSEHYRYLILGSGYSHPSSPDECACTEAKVALFLMAVQPGCFLQCNGRMPEFDKPLGAPTGPAVQDAQGRWSRRFASGTTASWANGTGQVQWAS